VSSPETAFQAAERGIGMFGVSFGSLQEQSARIEQYRRTIQDCEPVGAFVNEQVAISNWLYCSEDEQEAEAMGRLMVATFNILNTQFVGIRNVYPALAYRSLLERKIRYASGASDDPKLIAAAKAAAEAGKAADISRAANGLAASGGSLVKTQVGEFGRENLAFGTPQRCIDVLKRWESAGVEQVVFLLNEGTMIPQDKVLASMRLFAAEVMPAFKGNGKSAKGSGQRTVASAVKK
jgi:alkanesulfonate monooxygenase SsuD/methylene tetrahydromethanopterin reductase-like flavin-dependent oxidoreductase (luciferase family)